MREDSWQHALEDPNYRPQRRYERGHFALWLFIAALLLSGVVLLCTAVRV